MGVGEGKKLVKKTVSEKGVIEVDEELRKCPVMENKDQRTLGSHERKS